MENEFFAKLKSSTRNLHMEVEQSPISKSIMDPQVNLSTYTEYLSRLFLVHQTMEHTLFPKISSVITDITKRKKSDSIRKDLDQLQTVCPVEYNELSLPGYRDNLNFNLGMLYVTEGSTLGGLHILKNLRQSMGPEIPGNFFYVYGEKTGTMWKEFLAQLNDYQSTRTEADREEIIAGALYGFQWVKHIFEQATVE